MVHDFLMVNVMMSAQRSGRGLPGFGVAPRIGVKNSHASVWPLNFGLRGNVCPARARRATFLLTIPTSALDLPSHGEAPQVDHVGLHTFPTNELSARNLRDLPAFIFWC